MWQSYPCIWLHFIWSTKNQIPLIKKEFKFKIHGIIRKVTEDNDIHLDFINGVEDHVHLLISAKTTQCPADIVRIIKGTSYHEINDLKILQDHFHWQDGFGVFSVSPQNINRVRNYIRNQEKHHQTMSLENEMKNLMKNADSYIKNITKK